jgi:hypothetical protein
MKSASARPATPVPDLFGLPPIGDVPDDVARGLAALATSAPLWPLMSRDRWSAMVTAVQAFAAVHDAQARACGWDSLSLYGLHRRAPSANLAAMGAAWVAARSGHRVATLDRDGIVLIGAGGGRLRLYRTVPDEHVVVAWSTHWQSLESEVGRK